MDEKKPDQQEQVENNEVSNKETKELDNSLNVESPKVPESKPQETVEPENKPDKGTTHSVSGISGLISNLPKDKPSQDDKKESTASVKINEVKSNRISPKLLIFILFLLLLILGGGIWFFMFRTSDLINPIPQSIRDQLGDSGLLSGGDKSYESPLNGLKYTDEEAAQFKDLKPVAIMVNNHKIARPASGLSKADIIYEAVAEGGITRLMPVFFSQTPENVSSIRSARYYFVELASGYKAHYIHWGAAYVPECQKYPIGSPNYCSHGQIETQPDVDAKARIVQLGVPNIDVGGYESNCDINNENCFVSRDPEREATMGKLHAGFVKFPLIYEKAKDVRPQEDWHQYVEVTEWLFKDDAPLESRGNIGLDTPITYSYWETMPDFNVSWKYDKENNEYIRSQGGETQIDMENNKELRAKSIVVRFTIQEPANDYKSHLRHTLVGEGDLLVFQDGNVIEGKWTRETHDTRDEYWNTEGDKIELVRGQVWVQLVPSGNVVNYTNLVENVDTTNLPE